MTQVLITGSRHATTAAHGAIIFSTLKTFARNYFSPHTLWHGDAPGVDRIAAHIADSLGWNIQAIPANWNACRDTCKPGHRKLRRDGTTYCPTAGNYRNQLLVDGVVPYLPDVQAYAFPLPGSRGTWNCVKRIKASPIPFDPTSDIITLTPAVTR